MIKHGNVPSGQIACVVMYAGFATKLCKDAYGSPPSKCFLKKKKKCFCVLFFDGSVFCCGKVFLCAFFPSKCGHFFSFFMLATSEFCNFIYQFLCFFGLVS